ncbi:POT family-domain-containing protein [Usnea florida]
MALNAVFTDIVATQPPKDVVEPHGSNAFALNDGAAYQPEIRLSVDEEKILEAGRPSVANKPDYPPPTDEERSRLRKVADSIPSVSYWLCAVEFAERASYYGVQTVFSNFLEFPLPQGGNGAGAPPSGTQQTAGALGRGEQFSNAFVLLFTFLAYAVPIYGAYVADVQLGRYKTIIIGVIVCGVAHVILIGGAVPSVLQAGKGMAPFMIGFFLLAFGAGIFKPNIAPTIIDQYVHQKEYTKVLKSGEKVIMDPEATIQRIMLIFYGLVNVGAFFALATTYCEKDIGYWLAYLTPGILYFLLPFLLIILNKRVVKHGPDSSVLTNVFKITWVAIKQNKFKLWGKGYLNAAKPSVLAAKGITTINGKPISWTDQQVDDTARTYVACTIFLYFPIYNNNDGGIGNTLTNQGAAMTTNGAPNDLLSNFNPLTIIIVIPLLSYGVYPMLRKYNIKFGRISRITFGFILATISGVIGAIVQWRVYETSPCGYYASSCSIGTGVSPLSIWWQVPNVALGAISECFCNVTAYEIAYARSPKSMKSVVFALFLFNDALSSALGEVLTSVTVDPHLIWVWAGLAIALAAQTIVFHWSYREMDNDEFMIYQDDREAIEEYRRGSVADRNAASVENKGKMETLEEVKTDSVNSTAGLV